MSPEDETIGPDVAAAGRLITETISRDLAVPDLYDALEAARHSSTPYSSPPKEWPSIIDAAIKRDLPPVLIERYNAAGGQGTAHCGIFPSIRRAWATVDNSLFLWRFDKWDGQCPEYNGEEQVLCAVGLAKVKPGIFVEAIRHVLILATPVEIILLGVCCSASADGSDPYAELTIQPLHDYSVPSDGVTMTCIQSTDKGRIFLAGQDGNIYELLYSLGSGWKSRCRKVCHTGGLGSLLSRWVLPNSFTFGTVDPVLEIVIDNERNILYSRTHESKIQVFDLGITGDNAPKKVAEERNLGDHRDGRSGRRSTSRAQKSSIVSISTISPTESKALHLVAVTADGRRMYMSTSSAGSRGLTVSTSSAQRPVTLKLIMSRPAPAVGAGGVVSFGNVAMSSTTQPENLVLKIEGSCYSSGFLLLSDSCPGTMSRLLVATRDFTMLSGGFNLTASSGRNFQALRETVVVSAVDGRTLSITDALPPPEYTSTVEAAVWELADGVGGEGEITKARRLWARGDLAIQHTVPRRRFVVFSNTGLMELVFNRPVDLLHKILDNRMSHSLIEEFFQRYGAGEAAAMCLLLAARLIPTEGTAISSSIAERAAEAFEDPRLVGFPQMQGSTSTTSPVGSPAMGFNMGQVVQEAIPIYSGAHEGLCLCTARLLLPVWELPIMMLKGDSSLSDNNGGVVTCRISVDAMQSLEDKLRSLEQFLRARRNQRRGQYGRIFGVGDMPGFFGGGDLESVSKNLFDAPRGSSMQGSIPKRPRVPYSAAELSVMEVRSMELIRRLLRRSGEALLLLQLLSQHHIARLVQTFDSTMRHKLVHLTFHQLVCSEDGEKIATRLVASLMEYYVGIDGQGTVDDISIRLRDGCPSFYQEADYTFYQAVEFLKRARESSDVDLREKFAREALTLLVKVPESADLLSVCQRFEEVRFYEAVVELPLRKAKALDPNEDAFNDHIDENRRDKALSARRQCYEIVGNALRHLKDENTQISMQPGFRTGQNMILDVALRDKYIRQIIQLSVRWPDQAFHEYLYQTMIEIGLETELLELAGPDLVPFLQNAGSVQVFKAGFGRKQLDLSSAVPSLQQSKQPVTAEQAKYLELLARYYVHHRQHLLAAHVLLRLAERRHAEGRDALNLDQRFQYLSNAVLQARSANIGTMSRDVGDGGFLELLEGKLAVLRFQIRIKEELEFLIRRSEENQTSDLSDVHMKDSFPESALLAKEAVLVSAKEKLEDIQKDSKSISQLYNDFAVPYEMWEICLEILDFSNYSRDAQNNVMKDTWVRLIEHALRVGGIAEACTVLRRVGPKFFPGDGGSLPLDAICLHLEKAAEERLKAGQEVVGTEDISRALIVACKETFEVVHRVYDKLLGTGAVLHSPYLRLRMLQSALTVMREWSLAAFGTTIGGTTFAFNGTASFPRAVSNQGVKDKLSTAANRYMTEVRRLPLAPNVIEPLYQGFRELEEKLMGASSF